MDLLTLTFPISGVTTNALLPPLVSFVISFFTSMGGISGAFLLLPFQMSVLHYTAPSVSGTNHVYNIIAIPSGVYRYIKEGRMAWPLTWIIIAGTLPGVFVGSYLRVFFLPDPRSFKLFAGCVLLYVGIRLAWDVLQGRMEGKKEPGSLSGEADSFVKTISMTLARVEYDFQGERYAFSTPGMFSLALVVGIIGGAYGIGGGAIIAPFCVAFFRLPIHSIAGATLMGTFITSIAGAAFFTLLPASGGGNSMPDWPLGALFGLGGFLGMYLGARAQKHMPQRTIKVIVACAILSLAARYILQYF
jgi:uncharacterized membrane protein YfcA